MNLESRDFALKSLFSFFAALLCYAVSASFEYSPNIIRAHNFLYNLYVKDCRRLLDEEHAANPENKAVEASRAALIFAEATAADVDDVTRRSIGQIKKLLKEVESDKALGVHHLIARTELNIYTGMLHVRLNNRLRAASDFLSAYNAAKSAYSKYPKDAMVRLLWGNMMATIGSLPSDLRRYLSVIGFSGDVQKGIAIMKSAHKSITTQREYKPYLTRANLLFLITLKQLVDNEEVLPQNEGINIQENTVIAVVSAKVLMEQGHNEQALSILESNKPRTGQARLHYYHFLYGKAKLSAGRADAEQSFLSFLREYKGVHHLKATHKYLSWHYLLNDDFARADSVRRLIPMVGAEVIGPDQQAAREAEVPLNKVLIKARVLFDGGYLSSALEVLLADTALQCCHLPDEKAEYYYRLGRIYQKQGLVYPAINAFENAVSVHDVAAFNRANASLQAALLFEKIGQKEHAKNYFQKCLAMKGFPYQEGLHQKAKAGLLRVDSLTE